MKPRSRSPGARAAAILVATLSCVVCAAGAGVARAEGLPAARPEGLPAEPAEGLAAEPAAGAAPERVAALPPGPDETPAPERSAAEVVRALPLPELLRLRWEAPLDRAEHALRRATRRLPAPARRLLVRTTTPAGRVQALAAAGALLVLLVATRLLRGRGDLGVCISYPAELRGTFGVRIAARPGRYRRRPRRQQGEVLEERVSTPTEHHLVSRETHFRRIRPGTWFVTIEGVLQDPETGEVLADSFEEKKVVVRGRRTRRIELDCWPTDCWVEVRVLWDDQPVREAAVTARGAPHALRYTRGGPLRLSLPKGTHTVVVGSGDRVGEREVDVHSFQPTVVSIDLAGAENVVFKGCPPAVEPYLHDDLGAAARALERDGQSELAHLLRARLHREQGDAERAAQHFEAAGHPLEAAELRASRSDWTGAAALFVAAGDLRRAAEMYRRAGDLVRAGQTFEKVRELDSAIRCYREAGDVTRWVDLLERRGELFAAAQIAIEHGDRARSLRLLQAVLPDDEHFAEACRLLADAFEREGHCDMAAGKLREHLRASGGEGDPALHVRLAELLERADELDEALEVLSALRERAPTHPGVATRIETLRKKRSEREAPADGSPTATLLSKGRYEIVREIGRGGMGVVFRARDRRLGREVALKRLPENLRDHPKAVELFLREAQAAARLNHPNIVTVYDADQEDDVFFITMELLEGYPLNTVLQKKGRLRPPDVARVGRQVAAGLHYAHQRGLVHRDIKTANLFYTLDKKVMIMDFGLAKMVEAVRKAQTVIGGTPFYMAPEQAHGGHVDHRADLYAFGVTLFELATGSVPFPDGDASFHHRNTPPPDPRSLAADVPEELVATILHMMEKRPEDRPGSAAEVSEALEQVLRS